MHIHIYIYIYICGPWSIVHSPSYFTWFYFMISPYSVTLELTSIIGKSSHGKTPKYLGMKCFPTTAFHPYDRIK